MVRLLQMIMNKISRIFRWFVVGVASLCCTASFYGQAAAPGVSWEKYFGDNANWYESQVVAASPKGELLVGLRSSQAFSERYLSPHIWSFNQNGEKVSEFQISGLNVDGSLTKPDQLKFTGLSTFETGDMAAVLADELGHLFLVKMDAAANVVFAKNIEVKAKPHSLRVSKVIWAGDHTHLFLIGHEAFDAYVARVELTGAVAWEKKIDKGRMELFTDGIATDDGGIALVANSGQYDMFRVGPSEAWISRYSADGRETRQPGFIGRYGSLARTSDGNFWLVYDKSNSSAQEIWARVFSPDWKEVSASKIVSTKLGFSHFQVLALAAGGCLVQGQDDDRPYLAKLDPAGNVAAFTAQKGSTAVRFEMVNAGKSLFVVSSPFVEDERRKSSRKIDIMKLAIN
jgi:hypothetical protein